MGIFRFWWEIEGFKHLIRHGVYLNPSPQFEPENASGPM